jgi:hypothetical protein
MFQRISEGGLPKVTGTSDGDSILARRDLKGVTPLYMGAGGDALRKSWSPSRRLLYTVQGQEAKMEIPTKGFRALMMGAAIKGAARQSADRRMAAPELRKR